MPDIVSNTKRFTDSFTFRGASNNDLIQIAAQALAYADEAGDPSVSNVLLNLRWENDCIDADDTKFTFDYAGMTFAVMTEDYYSILVTDIKESILEEARWELERLTENHCYGSYITIDEDKFMRDLEYDEEGLVSHYDGVVHEMYWAEYGAGRTCCGYANDASPDTVIRRGTLYMIRED